ncbi:hypothetical protein Tco_1314858 [Tanacetum coccineum]
MVNLTFADSHNMVAYLEKSEDNADFAEIVDFLNASPIRRDLHFDDEDGITCLTNTEIFENLQLMGYEKLSDKLTFLKPFFSPQWKYLIHTILQCLSSKSTAWNEFGTNIASAVICLAKKQKFNFSKLIFDGMLRNLDPNSKKFLMYPRFLQLFLNNQIENLAAVFNDEYDTPSHTKKVFANMRRQGKDFLGTVTPLFATMLIQPQADVGEGSGQPTESQHTPTTASPSHVEPIPTVASSSHPKKTQKHRKTKRKATKISQSSGPTTLVADEIVHEERGDNVERVATTATSLDVEQGSDCLGFRNYQSKEESQEVGKEEKVKNSTTQEEVIQKDAETQGRYGHDISTAEVTTASVPSDVDVIKDKGKGIMQDPEKPVKVKGKDQIEYDVDVAQRLQVELDKEARLEREREEEASKAANIAEWDDVQAMMDAAMS